MNLNAIVLAAGQGKRMKSKLPKVLHPVCGKAMLRHVLDLLHDIEATRIIVVVGHGAEEVQSAIGSQTQFVRQEQQLGTGHAVQQAGPLLQDEDGWTLVVYGDTPLLTAKSIRGMIEMHASRGAAATVLTAEFGDPTGYGRILRDGNGDVIGIIEQKDCTPEQAAITEINTGTYIFDNRKLFAALTRVENNNEQHEYYLTDVLGIMRREGEIIAASQLADPAESIGVNDRIALAEVEAIMRRRINRSHMVQGVTLIDPETTYIEANVRIGSDTIIQPGTILKGNTVIGEDCVIGPQTEIVDSRVGSGSIVQRAVLLQSETGEGVSIGPFAYLRPGTKLADRVKVGDFVEIKNSTIGDGSKVPHLSYIGDAVIGSEVNIGCGTITANYDGVNKHQTVIEDRAFIGSNSNLIAPVRIGKGGFVTAGSTITRDVGEDDLAVARARQMNKPGYAAIIRNRKSGNQSGE